MHPEFEKLPHFRIVEIRTMESPAYQGVFDSSLRLQDRWIGYLVSDDDGVVEGRFYGFDRINLTAVFKSLASNDAGPLEPGKSFTYLDGYWGERLALVLDRSAQWNRTLFVPQDSDLYKVGDTMVTGPAGQAPPSPEWVYQRTIKAHRDHEHCRVCREKVAEYAQPFGYRSDTGKWICEKCYLDHVEPRRISFITDAAISQIRGER